MEYDSVGNRINVTVKLTAHDLEAVIGRKFDQKIDLEEHSDTSDVGKYLVQYLNHNFQMHSSDQQLKMTYLGRELTDRDDLYLFFFFKDVPNFKTVKITNRLLFSISDQQQNIVHYKYGNRTKSVTLVPAKSTDWITFEGNDEK